MLQATRTGTSQRQRKKASRKSVYKHHNRNAHAYPHMPGNQSPGTSMNKRNRRKSTIFKPTHSKQSMYSMVEASVMQDMQAPPSALSVKRRSISSWRKHQNEAAIKKSVMMNATQHQSLVDALGYHQHHTGATPSDMPKTASVATANTSAAGYGAVTATHNDHLAVRHQNMERGISAGMNVSSPVPKQSAVNALMRSVSTRGVTFADASEDSKTPLHAHEVSANTMANAAGGAFPSVPATAYELHELPFKPKNVSNSQRPSVSYSHRKPAASSTGDVHTTSTGATPYKLFTTPSQVLPSTSLSRPQSRRTSSNMMFGFGGGNTTANVIPSVAAATNANVNANANANPNLSVIANLMLVVFQALPPQQKAEVLQMMTLGAQQQPQLFHAAGGTSAVATPSVVQSSAHASPVKSMNPAIAAALNQANFTNLDRRSNATENTTKTSIKTKHVSFLPRSQTERVNSKSANSTPTQGSFSTMNVLKDRVHSHDNVSPRKPDKSGLNFQPTQLFQSKSTNGTPKHGPLTGMPLPPTDELTLGQADSTNRPALPDIRESSQSNEPSEFVSLTDRNSSSVRSALSFKDVDSRLARPLTPMQAAGVTEAVPLNAPHMTGALGTIQSGYDMDFVKDLQELPRKTATAMKMPAVPELNMAMQFMTTEDLDSEDDSKADGHDDDDLDMDVDHLIQMDLLPDYHQRRLTQTKKVQFRETPIVVDAAYTPTADDDDDEDEDGDGDGDDDNVELQPSPISADIDNDDAEIVYDESLRGHPLVLIKGLSKTPRTVPLNAKIRSQEAESLSPRPVSMAAVQFFGDDELHRLAIATGGDEHEPKLPPNLTNRTSSAEVQFAHDILAEVYRNDSNDGDDDDDDEEDNAGVLVHNHRNRDADRTQLFRTANLNSKANGGAHSGRLIDSSNSNSEHDAMHMFDADLYGHADDGDEHDHDDEESSQEDAPGDVYYAALQIKSNQIDVGSGVDRESGSEVHGSDPASSVPPSSVPSHLTDIETQRLGPSPLHPHTQHFSSQSMVNIGMDVEHDEEEDDDDEEVDHNYFGAGTPNAVRQGTETIQKTLRAIWVRGHTRIGTLIHLILILVNCMAAVMFVMAVEGYENDGLEFFFTSTFLVDFCIRVYAAKSVFSYLRSLKGIADFVSVIPGIILAVSDLHGYIPLWTFSFVRAMRVLRVLRLLAHLVNAEELQQEELHDPINIEAAEFMAQVSGNDEDAATQGRRTGCCACNLLTKKFWVMSKVTYFKITLMSYLIMVVFVGAGLFACVEGPQSETATVETFFDSFYFIVITVTTVGYGDYSPQTVPGKICVMAIVAAAFIVIPYRATLLAQMEFEYADQESEPSVMDFNIDALQDEEEEGAEGGSFLGYCANCAGPRWTVGTETMPIACIQCYHPVLTSDQVRDWLPNLADALDDHIGAEEIELLELLMDAKLSGQQGLLQQIHSLIRGEFHHEAQHYPTQVATPAGYAGNEHVDQLDMAHAAHMLMKTPSMTHATLNPNLASLMATPVGGNTYAAHLDPQLVMSAMFEHAAQQQLQSEYHMAAPPTTATIATAELGRALHVNVNVAADMVTPEPSQSVYMPKSAATNVQFLSPELSGLSHANDMAKVASHMSQMSRLSDYPIEEEESGTPFAEHDIVTPEQNNHAHHQEATNRVVRKIVIDEVPEHDHDDDDDGGDGSVIRKGTPIGQPHTKTESTRTPNGQGLFPPHSPGSHDPSFDAEFDESETLGGFCTPHAHAHTPNSNNLHVRVLRDENEEDVDDLGITPAPNEHVAGFSPHRIKIHHAQRSSDANSLTPTPHAVTMGAMGASPKITHVRSATPAKMDPSTRAFKFSAKFHDSSTSAIAESPVHAPSSRLKRRHSNEDDDEEETVVLEVPDDGTDDDDGDGGGFMHIIDENIDALDDDDDDDYFRNHSDTDEEAAGDVDDGDADDDEAGGVGGGGSHLNPHVDGHGNIYSRFRKMRSTPNINSNHAPASQPRQQHRKRSIPQNTQRQQPTLSNPMSNPTTSSSLLAMQHKRSSTTSTSEEQMAPPPFSVAKMRSTPAFTSPPSRRADKRDHWKHEYRHASINDTESEFETESDMSETRDRARSAAHAHAKAQKTHAKIAQLSIVIDGDEKPKQRHVITDVRSHPPHRHSHRKHNSSTSPIVKVALRNSRSARNPKNPMSSSATSLHDVDGNQREHRHHDHHHDDDDDEDERNLSQFYKRYDENNGASHSTARKRSPMAAPKALTPIMAHAFNQQQSRHDPRSSVELASSFFSMQKKMVAQNIANEAADFHSAKSLRKTKAKSTRTVPSNQTAFTFGGELHSNHSRIQSATLGSADLARLNSHSDSHNNSNNHHSKDSSSLTPHLSAFQQSANFAKSMTDLFVVDQMQNQQSMANKKNRRKRNLSRTKNADPIKDHFASKVMAQLLEVQLQSANDGNSTPFNNQQAKPMTMPRSAPSKANLKKKAKKGNKKKKK